MIESAAFEFVSNDKKLLNSLDLFDRNVFRFESLSQIENNQTDYSGHIVKRRLCFTANNFSKKIEYKPAAYNTGVDFNQKPNFNISPFSNQLGNIDNNDVCWFCKNEVNSISPYIRLNFIYLILNILNNVFPQNLSSDKKNK